MTTHPTVGEIVAITTTNSNPLLLVRTVGDEHINGVLLADLATETLHRLRASEYDTPTRRQLGQAIGRTDEPFRSQIACWLNAIAAVLGHSQEGMTDGPR